MKATITLGIIKSHVVASSHVHDILYKELSVKDPSAHWRRKYSPHVDKWKRFYSSATHMFPTGLFRKTVKPILERHNIEYEIRDTRPKLKPKGVDIKSGEKIKLRGKDIYSGKYSFQGEAVHTAIRKRRGIIRVPTSGGKTVMFAAMIKAIKRRTLILEHSRDLLHQTREVIEETTGMKVGTLGDGIDDRKKVTVATVQTIAANLPSFHSWLASCEVVIVDEAHRVGAASCTKVLRYCTGAVYRYAFSGTPIIPGNDIRNWKLIGLIGPMLVYVTASELQSRGVVAQPTVYFLRQETPGWMNDQQKRWIRGYSYQEAYELLVAKNHQRNLLIKEVAEWQIGVGKKVLILVQRLVHLEKLGNLLPEATTLSREDPSEVRRGALKKLAKGELQCIIATPIFDEGIDAPALDTLIMAAAGKSFRQTLQRIGRAMRRRADKSTCLVLDFKDDLNPHLRRHTQERMRIAEMEGYRVLEGTQTEVVEECRNEQTKSSVCGGERTAARS